MDKSQKTGLSENASSVNSSQNGDANHEDEEDGEGNEDHNNEASGNGEIIKTINEIF